MTADVIDQLLQGAWRDPDSGDAVAPPLRSIVIADSLDGMERQLIADLGLGRRLALVSDPTTHAVLGARVERALTTLGAIDVVRLPEHPHADAATADRLRHATKAADALVAVGSGTINDLCKYAAFRDGKPYAVFGTAPSMNGYSSANAAITEGGLKKSLAAATPAGVFLDLRVLAAAPVRMIRSGLGDSLCRSTAQADWLLSHLLRGTAYRRAPFDLLVGDEADLFDGAEGLVRGDVAAMRCLARTLVLSGLGMVLCGGSYPASQGEHLIGHYIEMMGRGLPATFHGEQIGVATLTMARLQERLLETAPVLRPTVVDDADILAHFGPETGAACLKELRAKALSDAEADRLNQCIAREWPDWQSRIAAVAEPAARLQAVLERAGAAVAPAALGIPKPFYQNAVWRARQIRNRYTFLDLAADAGPLRSLAAMDG